MQLKALCNTVRSCAGVVYLRQRSKTKKLLCVMKLTALFLLGACLQVSATGHTQQISISEKNASLQKVFKQIQKQSGYDFLYSYEMLQQAGKVSINVHDVSLEEALGECLKGTSLGYSIMAKTVVIKPKPVGIDQPNAAETLPPPIDIRGRVVNEEGEPLEGVTVSVKGSQNATFTNANGEFQLKNVDANATLVFTSIAVEDYELKINGKKNLSVSLKTKVSAMGNVVIAANTGYQTISKERAPGAFDVVGQDILSKRPVSNISTALQGIVPGMQAKENLDGSVDFLIRGTSSLYANTQPLVVVDGFPVSSSDFSDINPNDVESVTVLKDASAASIWGARSANGVIVITTKKPKIGKNKINIEVNAFTRVSNMIDLDQVMTQATSSEQIKYERLAWENEWLFNPYAQSFTEIGKSLTLGQELLFANKNGLISTEQMNKGLDSLARINNRDQFKNQLMRHGILNQFNLSLSSATDRSRSYASLMYENKKEGFKKRGYDRLLLNFNNQYQVTDFLQVQFGANIQYKKTETSGAEVGDLQQLSPYETLLNPDGSYSTNLRNWNREQMALLPLSKFPYADWSYNLLREVNGRSYKSEDISARLQGGLNVRILKSLNFDAKIQYEKRRINNENYDSEETFYVRNLVNQYTEYDNATKTVGISYLPKGGILRSGNSDLESYVIRNQLNFNKSFSSQHQIVAIAGMEISRYLTTSRSNPYAYGYFPEKLQSTVPQYGYGSSVDRFKDFRGTTVTSLSGGNTTFGWGLDKYVSYYGNASYTYNSKYTLSGSIRNDASNFITDDPDLRWAPLWSVGAMWNLKREDFMNKVDFVDRLNVRLTYGKNGNVEKSTSPKTLISVSNALSATTGTITASITDNGNPLLSWERTSTTNLGIDFSLFRDRLFGKLDLYNKLGENIMGTVALPAATGTTSQRFNNAQIINRGVEIELGTKMRISNAIDYSTSVSYAYNWNRIDKLYFPALYAYAMIDGAFVEGRPVGSVYSYTYAGMIDGIPHVAGPKGAPSTFNSAALHNRGLGLQFLNYEGTQTPPHTLGWINNFSAYNFNVVVLFVGKMGGVYRNPTFNFATTIGSNKTFVDKYVADVYAGDPNIPQFANPKETQTYLWDRYTPYLSGLIESSSYIECKEIDLEYNLPSRIAKAIRMDNLKVFAQVRDLGLLWKANSKGYNPDWLPGSNRPVTTYMFGVNLKF
jgi:TonB-linked SusC/RagA family outer membrane protein